jgi:outer membrane protein
VEERRRTAISAARVAWNNLVSARANIATAHLQVTASTEALGDIRMQRDIGSRTTTDVLDAEREVLQARILLVEIETDARLAAAQVSAATGTLAMEQLEADLETPPLRAPEH